MRYRLILLLATLVTTLALPAKAEGPAVGAVNGKVSVESGATSTLGRSSAVGTAQGALTAPLGHSFGVELDAIASLSHGAFSGGGLGQVFWRDPALGQVGPFAGLVGGNGSRVFLTGGEGQLFAPNLTLQGFGGWLDAAASTPLPIGGSTTGGFFGGHLTLYPDPNWALTAGARQAIGRAMGTAQIEVLPDITPRRNLSFFVSAEAGDNQAYRVTGGIRFYFGPDKSLIRRHREDDLSYATLSIASYYAWLLSIY